MKGISNMADVRAAEHATPPPCSTYEMIGVAARQHADAPALSFFLRAADHHRPKVWSYRQLFQRITATANFFHELGVDKRDVVAFLLPNLPETHFTIWGAEAAGIAFAINPLLEPAGIADLLRAGGAKVLVTLAPFPGVDLWQKVCQVLEKVPTLQHVVLVDVAEHAPGIKRLATRWLRRRETRRLHGRRGIRAAVPAAMQIHDFASSVNRQSTDRLLSGRRIRGDDLSSFFCTGGTTGTPKIAMRTHGNEVANAWSAAKFLGQGIGPSKNIFCGLPLFHVNAVLVTGLLPFSRGAHVVLGTPQGYRGDEVVPRFWEIVERHRINFFSGVPTLYSSLTQQPVQGRDIGSLEYGLCGAAPLSVELTRTFQDRTHLKILEGYGLTEGTCVSTCNPPLGERREGSIGLRVPLQEMKAVLLDDTGHYLRDCRDDEVGVLVISGPNVFAGYKSVEHNAGLWVNCGDDRRWLNTGDLGRRDADGYFYLTGRKKELIIRGGHNIDPASIEEPLQGHPAVQLVAAVGRPDSHAGELPVAYVQLRPGTMAAAADLLEYARQHIQERAAVPKAVRVIAAMPLTAVGKIFKPALRRIEIEDAITTALADAGIKDAETIAELDQQRGIALEVRLPFGASRVTAEQVLGTFPFSYAIQ